MSISWEWVIRSHDLLIWIIYAKLKSILTPISTSVSTTLWRPYVPLNNENSHASNLQWRAGKVKWMLGTDSPYEDLYWLYLTPNLIFSTPGVWAVYFMRWLPGGLCSLALLWRTNCTSSSDCWVSAATWWWENNMTWWNKIYLLSVMCVCHLNLLVLNYTFNLHLCRQSAAMLEPLWLPSPPSNRNTLRGQLAWHLLHGGVQVLQVPQVQDTAPHQPCSQVCRATGLGTDLLEWLHHIKGTIFTHN